MLQLILLHRLLRIKKFCNIETRAVAAMVGPNLMSTLENFSSSPQPLRTNKLERFASASQKFSQ
jgi:hypothetical protein